MDAKVSTFALRVVGSPDLASIQYLRGIAAVMVVFAHANDQFPYGAHLLFRGFGWSGVDLFFVISGFVMTITADSRHYSRSVFLRHRIARIVPLYWVATTVIAILAVALPIIFARTRFTWDGYATSLLFIPYQNASMDAIAPLLKLGWTLNYEMFFYAIFAVLIGLSAWYRTATIAATFLLFFVASIAVQLPSSALVFWSRPVSFEFVFGCAAGAAYVNRWLSRVPLWLSLLVAAVGLILLIAGGAIDASTGNREIWRGIPAMIIVLSCVAAEGTVPLKNSALHRLGDATYSIYLTHLFSVLIVSRTWTLLHFHASEATVYVDILGSTVVAVWSGIFVHKRFEVRLNRWAKRLLV